MNNYKDVLIIHPIDQSTTFLAEFEKHFKKNYCSFDNDKTKITQVKNKLGDLETKSLIIYIGHGSSSGLYEPNEEGDYDKYFLDVNWGNHFFEDHDVILLSCKSSEFIQKLYNCKNIIGFGNIVSSFTEVKISNEKTGIKKNLIPEDVDYFNNCYVSSIIKSLKLLISDKIKFNQMSVFIEYFINKEINNVLKNKSIENNVEIARLLFEFRNEMFVKND